MTASDKWVFGYASLMWRPGFDFVEARPATVFGYHRALCIYSFIYRGSRDAPGLVAGLLSGGSCRGRAYRVTAEVWPNVKQYLDQRELIYDVYQPRWASVRAGDDKVTAYTFVANRSHEQFAGKLEAETAAAIVRDARGEAGSGITYLENTIGHLADMGIHDHGLLDVWNALSRH